MRVNGILSFFPSVAFVVLTVGHLLGAMMARLNNRSRTATFVLRWPIHIINPVEKKTYLVILPTEVAPQFL